jgi:DNA-binding MarR family transcriptional regulator
METTDTLRYLLQHTSTIMQRQADQVLQERLGIGMSQFKILSTLQDRPNVQQRFLAGSLGQTEASISRQIKLLIEKAMVAVQINPKNRREHVTILTPKGVKVTQAARDTLEEYHEPAFGLLTDKEKQQLADILSTMHLHYCQEGKPYACDLPWFSQFGKEVV